jgi:Glycine-zipper domain
MKIFVIAVATLATMASLNGAKAATKSQRCESYAHNAMRSTPTSTGLIRGAARGAVGGAIFGNVGRGAAIGAAVGGTRRLAQKSRSYSYYYNSCMRR